MSSARESKVGHEISHGPSFALLRLDLTEGKTVVAESGSMVARHADVLMEVRLNAGTVTGFLRSIRSFFIAFVRRIVGGETFFVNHFSATKGGSVWIAPTLSGQVQYRRLSGGRLILSAGSYLAHAGDVVTRIKFGGLKSLLAKEGAFLLEITGHGDLWFTSYGAIHAIEVDGSYTVDNGHLVGYEGDLDYAMSAPGGGVLGFLASGEGMVCTFSGKGTVYIQSRNLTALVKWLGRVID